MKINCKSCGNKINLEKGVIKVICSYCGTENVLVDYTLEKIVPFFIDKLCADNIILGVDNQRISLDDYDSSKQRKFYSHLVTSTVQGMINYDELNIFTDDIKSKTEQINEEKTINLHFGEGLKLEDFFGDTILDYKEELLFGLDVDMAQLSDIKKHLEKACVEEFYERNSNVEQVRIDFKMKNVKKTLVPIFSVMNEKSEIFINGQNGVIFFKRTFKEDKSFLENFLFGWLR